MQFQSTESLWAYLSENIVCPSHLPTPMEGRWNLSVLRTNVGKNCRPKHFITKSLTKNILQKVFCLWAQNIGEELIIGFASLLAPQSGALRISAYRDFQSNPLIAFEHLSLSIVIWNSPSRSRQINVDQSRPEQVPKAMMPLFFMLSIELNTTWVAWATSSGTVVVIWVKMTLWNWPKTIWSWKFPPRKLTNMCTNYPISWLPPYTILHSNFSFNLSASQIPPSPTGTSKTMLATLFEFFCSQ